MRSLGGSCDRKKREGCVPSTRSLQWLIRLPCNARIKVRDSWKVHRRI